MTGIQWWTPLVTACKQFADTEPDMDYIFPRINSQKTMYLTGPATHSAVLSMYRHILATNGVDGGTVADVTLHGLRLWAAEVAY